MLFEVRSVYLRHLRSPHDVTTIRWFQENSTATRVSQQPSKVVNKKNGAWVLLRENDLTLAHEARDTNMPISAIRLADRTFLHLNVLFL